MSLTGMNLRRNLRRALDHIITRLEALDAPPPAAGASAAGSSAATSVPAAPSPAEAAAPDPSPSVERDTAAQGAQASAKASAAKPKPQPVKKLAPLPTLNTRRPTRSLKRDTSAVLETPPTAILDTPLPPRPTPAAAASKPVTAEPDKGGGLSDDGLTPAGRKAKQSPEARQKAHWQKARRGLLEHVHNQGGKASLRELHDHSERTFFIAHQSFSRMMEELTDDELLDYDHDTATAALTAAGLAELG